MVPPDRLTALFAEYHGPLVRFLTRRLGDRDAAEEIAQETFMRAMKQETITSERSWLFAVASNLVRDEGRRAQRQQRRLELLINLPLHHADGAALRSDLRDLGRMA